MTDPNAGPGATTSSLGTSLVRAGRVAVATGAGCALHAVLPMLAASPVGPFLAPLVAGLLAGLGKLLRVKWNLPALPF